MAVQSFSSKVLKDMNRPESEGEIVDFFKIAREKIAGVSFSSDVMVGFPTESEEDFEKTLSWVQKIKFLELFMYYYNPRPNTLSAKLYKDLPLEVKKKRLSRLIDCQMEVTKKLKSDFLGKREKVIAVRESKKEKDMILCFTKDKLSVLVDKKDIKVNEMKEVELISMKGTTFHGKTL